MTGTMKMNQHIAGGVAMLFGLVLVFGLVVLMNHFMGKIEKSPPQEVTEISITKEIKQEPKKEIKKIEPKKQVTRPQAPTPFKGLDTALSGIDLGLLGLDSGQGGDLDDRLLGKTGNDGSVNQVQVLESSPSGIFDTAALQGIRSWHFEPAKYKGDTVRVWAKQKIRFDLS